MTEKPEPGASPPPPVPRWECPNCGQQHFGDSPPDMCDYCDDFTTWRRVTASETDGPASSPENNN